MSERANRDDLADSIRRDFHLEPGNVVWHWALDSGRGRKVGWSLRDRLAFKLADEIKPVSVRPSGRMAALIRGSAKLCVHAYSVTYNRPQRSPQWERRLPGTTRAVWPSGSLVHLTRACDGPWPGESRWQYYEALERSTSNPRSAFATLCRIIERGCVLGSAFRAREGGRRVCLTACDAGDALSLARFRSRYARYSFEPYAIVLPPTAAVAAGARPVSYDDRDAAESAFRQGAGARGHWRREKEWRIAGDLDLTQHRDVVVVTATDEEAARLRRWCPHEVRSFGCAEPGRLEEIDHDPDPWASRLSSNRV